MMRFGGVFVTMSRLRAPRSESTMYAPIGVRYVSGWPSIQPKSPPDALSAGMPSCGSGRSPATWQNAAITIVSSPNPMPIRPLSCTDDGWRNSHPARSSSRTGKTNAVRPMSMPNVYALMFAATGVPMKNHSVTAPAIANSTMRKGKPSRLSFLSRVSGPNARNSPPTARARPYHIRAGTPGLSSSPTYFFGAGADLRALEDVFERALLFSVLARAISPTVRGTDDIPPQ